MSKKTSNQAVPEMPKESPPSIRLEFGKKLKAPKEFDQVSTGDSVRVVVTGKVLMKEESESADQQNASWENYQRMRIEISAVDIEPLKSKAKTMKEAMEEVTQKRKM